MIKLMTLICEGMKLNPLMTFQELRRAKTITCYHASEDANFQPLDTPLHVGSLQQSLALVQNMKKGYGNKNFYLYELVVNLGEISPYMYDEDPQVDPDNSRYNSYAYSNRIEYLMGLHKGNNISVVIINPREQIESKRLVKSLTESVTSVPKSMTVYHGTGLKFRKFNLKYSTQGIVWFTSDKNKILNS